MPHSQLLASLIVGCAGITVATRLPAQGTAAAQATRPNILWLSTEDMSPHLGCYGDVHARTPHLDRFAAEGVLYENAFAVAPVCAPSRSSIITGMYPTTLGTHNMRSRVRLPDHVKCFSEYLRAAGYYCTNNVKTDYQFDPPAAAWDESSGKAHWKNRPSAEQPFFAVFNFTGTHESHVRGDRPAYDNTVRTLSAAELHDPASLTLPPYHPDTPAVREDWARYYNCVTAMDKWLAAHLQELEAAGLADDTIVFFWGDHGVGLPRGKRWLYDSGLRVPLVVRIPEKFRRDGQGGPGAKTQELVVLMDLGPTVLNLCGVAMPSHMQGRAFLGDDLLPEREYVYASRDRMDEYYDMSRAVRDKRFKYIRNYEPWKPYAQPLQYAEQSPTMRELRRLHASGELPDAAQAFMAATKPVHELYDTQSDPHELHNLESDPRYYETLRFMQIAHENWMRDTLDLGFIPEAQLEEAEENVGSRYEVLRQDRLLAGRRLQELFGVAQLAGDAFGGRGGTIRPELLERMRLTDDPAFRFWLARWAGQYVGKSPEARSALAAALGDADGSVRTAAATWLADTEQSRQAIDQLAAELGSEDWWTRLRAVNLLDRLGVDAPAVIEQVRQTHQEASGAGHIGAGYVARVAETVLEKAGND